LFDTATPPPLNSLTEGERMALVESCKRTCAHEARRAARNSPGHEFEDLEQEALLACVEASRRWSPDAGTKFNTYATACIRRYLQSVTARHRGDGIVHLESWDAVVQPDGTGDEPDGEPDPLTARQEDALARLGEPARTILKMVVVDGLTPDQVATQLDRPVKDIKLIMRNAAKALPKEIVRASTPSLFGEVA
jgi:RNA polymerase sigma factor (sigma-70 family)